MSDPLYVKHLERDGVTLYCGDARVVLPRIDVRGAVCVTDPVWPQRKPDLWPQHDAASLLQTTCVRLKRGGVKTVIVILGELQDPRFLACVPASQAEGWPFFRAVTLSFARVGYQGQKLNNGDVAYVFGEVPGPGNRILPARYTSGTPIRKEKGGHPCPRAIEHMRWLLEHYTAPDDVVLDPFAGRGTTLRAAQECGRRAIGIEVDARYCEEADRYLAQRVMFAPEVSP